MWQTAIDRQSIEVEGRRFSAADGPLLARLASTEPCEALRDVYIFLAEWFSPSPVVQVQTSGSTGKPKRMEAEKARMIRSAVRTCEFLGLQAGHTALLCMDLKYIGAKMMVVRALVAGLRLWVRRASSHPLTGLDEHIDFLSIVPIQLYNTLQCAKDTERLSRARCVIVGGGPVDETLMGQLQGLPCRIFSTYGMTETLSHIALRPLNGPYSSDRYMPFPGVALSLSARGTLVIHAPEVCSTSLETNDVARLYPDGTFTIIGRADNTVNSGGLKLQIEEEEQRLKKIISTPFALTAVPDARLGEALVLLVDSTCEEASDESLLARLKACVPRHHAPRCVVRVKEIPQTGNGKTDRAACRKLAAGKTMLSEAGNSLADDHT